MEVYDKQFAMNEFTVGGEVFLQDALSQWQLKTIFDVGANIGEWSAMIREGRQMQAEIHLFEPMPCVFKRMKSNLDGQMIANSFGLSDKIGTVDVKYTPDNDRLTTPVLDLYRNNSRIIPLLMMDGDTYCLSRETETIDFLKIDTEGWEYKILLGFQNMIANGKIAVIQFEYGYANVLTKDLLIDFYRLLIPHGYIIGKLTTNGVFFKDYNLLDEDFKGPNYVAIHQSAPDFINAVSGT